MPKIDLRQLASVTDFLGFLGRCPRSYPVLTDVLKHDFSTEGNKPKFFRILYDEPTIPNYEILAISFYDNKKRKMLVIDLSGFFSKKSHTTSSEVVFFKDWCVWQEGVSLTNVGWNKPNDSVHELSHNIFALLLLSLKAVFDSEHCSNEFKTQNFQTLSGFLDFLISRNSHLVIKEKLTLLRNGLTQGSALSEEQKEHIEALKVFFGRDETWLERLTTGSTAAGPAQDEGVAVANSKETTLQDTKQAKKPALSDDESADEAPPSPPKDMPRKKRALRGAKRSNKKQNLKTSPVVTSVPEAWPGHKVEPTMALPLESQTGLAVPVVATASVVAAPAHFTELLSSLKGVVGAHLEGGAKMSALEQKQYIAGVKKFFQGNPDFLQELILSQFNSAHDFDVFDDDQDDQGAVASGVVKRVVEQSVVSPDDTKERRLGCFSDDEGDIHVVKQASVANKSTIPIILANPTAVTNEAFNPTNPYAMFVSLKEAPPAPVAITRQPSVDETLGAWSVTRVSSTEFEGYQLIP